MPTEIKKTKQMVEQSEKEEKNLEEILEIVNLTKDLKNKGLGSSEHQRPVIESESEEKEVKIVHQF